MDLNRYEKHLRSLRLSHDIGKVVESTGLLIRGHLPGAWVGSICELTSQAHGKKYMAEVVGFQGRSMMMMPLEDVRGLSPGARITVAKQSASVWVGESLLGRVLDGAAQPIDDKGELIAGTEVPLYREVRNPLGRRPIREALDLGVRALNGLLTVGRGQRVGIMAGSGVGKSVLMGMMARNSKADVNVIAMVGERGREVREFIESDLGPEGLAKSVVVVVTSDQSPLLRMRGAFVASAIAEYFADQGKDVLLMMDSVTRFAMAQREIGLSVGEPPATRGYTPSVFSILPRLLERAGSFESGGSITGLYTVLVESDDMDDPIGDAVRSIVDGHVVLSRALAQRGHFPAIDVLQSASRVMRQVTDGEHQRWAQKFRELLADYKDAEDLINIGAYKTGSNVKIDQAVRLYEPMRHFLRQSVEDPCDMDTTLQILGDITGNLR
ncbi:MAG: FliI/YscN family ATPase [Bdellovibrio sp.]